MVTNEVTESLLQEFKNKMHISHNEDDNLKDLLSSSISFIRRKCGDFDLEGKKDTDVSAKELVLERARYSYNDAVEYFEDNFKSEILSLQLDILLKEKGEEHEKV